MNTNRDMEVNGAATNLLISACPVQLGMPAKLIRELVHGKYSFLAAEDVCSLSKDGWELSMLDEYLDKQGYVFSWGTLSEVSKPSDPDDDKSPAILRFEFMPIEFLLGRSRKVRSWKTFSCGCTVTILNIIPSSTVMREMRAGQSFLFKVKRVVEKPSGPGLPMCSFHSSGMTCLARQHGLFKRRSRQLSHSPRMGRFMNSLSNTIGASCALILLSCSSRRMRF